MQLSAGLLGYLMLQLFFHSAVPEPSVDYGAMLNEAVTSAPIEQQAWPHYRELWTKYGLAEGGPESFKEIYVEDDNRRLIRPSDEKWDEAVAKLESLEELLDGFRKFSNLPHLGTPLHVDRRDYSDADIHALFPGLKREDLTAGGSGLEGVSAEADKLLEGATIGILLPHIQQFRDAARLLHVDTRLAVAQGDQERALANIKSVHGLGEQAADVPLFVCGLVGYAVHGIGFCITDEVIVENPDFFDANHLLELQQYIENLKLPEGNKLAFEQNLAKDLIQRIYSDDGNGDGRVTAVGAELKQILIHGLFRTASEEESPWYDARFFRSVSAPVTLFTAPTRHEMETIIADSHKEWIERIQRPMWEVEVTEWDEYLKRQDDSGLLQALIPGIASVKTARELKLAYRDAVLLALACHRYHKANQEWPTSLDQLVGEWLKDTPIDRINGKPLNFRIKDNAPVIYSLGHDGDDDGGVNTDSTAPWLDKTGDGDWIVWPQTDL